MDENGAKADFRSGRQTTPFERQISPLGSRISLVALLQALAVAEHLNFRRAAAALRISQSVVSQRIKTLEQDLGILLFERRHRGVRLTEAGRHFLEQVAVGIEHLDYAVKTAGMIARGEQGQLRVGLHSSIADGFLPDLLNRYRNLHPSVDIEIVEGRTCDIIRYVREERLDVAFVLGTPTIEDCHSKPLWSETLVVALPADHILAKVEEVRWADLVAETFLVRHGGGGPQMYDHVVLRLAEHWLQPSIRRLDIGRDTLMSMVAQGYGITLTSQAMTKVSFPDVVFRPILDEPEPIVFSAVWSPFNRGQTLRDFLNLAQQRSREFAKAMNEAAATPAAPLQTPDPLP
ncbi:Hca operon transcriptional activator [mine drainage metagenome]|uniref:Hca operon transcriptional activator n=1 Tax=mine drainage metagenome TaxID=410659 RepID=A0A1J5RN48_9ZZZZ